MRSITYRTPCLMSKENMHEMFRRFLFAMYHGEDPFIGCPSDIVVPLQVMVASFQKDIDDIEADMFAYVESISETGFRTIEEMVDFLDNDIATHEDAEEEELQEIEHLKLYLNGEDMAVVVIHGYIEMMKRNGYHTADI